MKGEVKGNGGDFFLLAQNKAIHSNGRFDPGMVVLPSFGGDHLMLSYHPGKFKAKGLIWDL